MSEPAAAMIPQGDETYTILINKVGEGVIELQVTQSDTIDQVKTAFARKTGLPQCFQRFIFFNQVLDDKRMTLGDLKVFKDALIDLVLENDSDDLVPISCELNATLQVRDLSGRTILVASKSCVTIDDLKHHIQGMTGIPPDQQRLIHAGKQLEDFWTLSYCNIKDGSVVHLALRLRGGGGPLRQTPQMGIAAGGFIKQTIKRDRHNPLSWDPNSGTIFNVQILNSTLFKHVTGVNPPSTPVNAWAYWYHNLPYFAIWDEKDSGIYGDFGGIQSVNERDQTGTMTQEKKEAVAEVSNSQHNTVVLLNHKGEHVGFRPVKTMEKEVREKFGGLKL